MLFDIIPEATMPPRAEAPTPLQLAETERLLCVERCHTLNRQLIAEQKYLAQLDRRIKRLRRGQEIRP